jgi:hypothetical protein
VEEIKRDYEAVEQHSNPETGGTFPSSSKEEVAGGLIF